MRFLIALFTVFSFTQVSAQGIEFFDGTWEEAIAEAKKQEKILFVDAYAAWCGPCKRMAKTVFTQKPVGDFYNANFINVKLDYEKREADVFRKDFQVSAFPTLFFIDYDGKTSVLTEVGGQQAATLIGMGKKALAKIDRSGDFEEKYAKGDRDPELIHGYVKALNQAKKPSLKVANDYLKSQDNLNSEQNLRIIYEATTEADSKIFDWLVEYRKDIEKLYSYEDVNKKIESACFRTVGKAIEYQLDMLHEEAVTKMKTHVPEKSAKFNSQADMLYYQGTGNVPSYLKACKTYAKKHIKKDGTKLEKLAGQMKNSFPLDAAVQKEAAKLGKKAEKLKKKA